ncbi:MAG: hypothetical protein WDZ79_02615 [Candidatus Paceibacterota bacterium]
MKIVIWVVVLAAIAYGVYAIFFSGSDVEEAVLDNNETMEEVTEQ